MSIMHNGEKVLNNINTVPITQTIDASSTEKEIPSAKAVNDKIDTVSNRIQPNAVMFRKENTSYSTLNELIQNHEFFKSSSTEEFIFSAEGFDDLPVTNWGFSIRLYTKSGNSYVVANMMLSNLFYTRYMNYNGTWDGGWQRVCTTSVVDVPTTTITPTLPSTFISNSKSIYYSVKNGWANVSIIIQLSSAPKTTDWTNIANGLPKPDKEINTSTMGENAVNGATVAFLIRPTGDLEMHIGLEITQSDWFNINFSYPVAES